MVRPLNELLQEITRHKTVFRPSLQAYLEYSFEYAYQTAEYEKIESDCIPAYVDFVMRLQAERCLKAAKGWYKRHNKLCVIDVPEHDWIQWEIRAEHDYGVK